MKLTKRIAQREGLVRFWRGLVPSVLLSFPGQANYYLAIETTQELLKKAIPNPEKDGKWMTFCRGFLSGAMAEMAGGLFFVPADIIAQRLQIQSTEGFVQNSRLYNGPMDVIRKLWGHEGLRGFYRGYFACKRDSCRYYCLCTRYSCAMGDL